MTEQAERYWEARWRDEHAENERLRAQRDQLLAALKFYADEENWREEGLVLHFGSQVRADEGEIARAAIFRTGAGRRQA
jgi:hypothetical protein